jgi:FixJ family two-component response regulator
MKNRTMKIIVMDDDLFFGTLITKFLHNLDFKNVSHYTNENVCLDSMPLNEPCIFLLDQELEHSKGLDLMKEIKNRNPQASIVFLSGQEYCHIAIKAIKEGAIDYIEKNKFALLEIKKILEQLTNQKQDSFDFKRFSKSA